MRPDDLIQGRYRLQHPLGKGGMAEVWCAHDERLQRPAAIKFLAAQFHEDPEFLVRFFSEAQLVARISHPHVTKILDFGEYQERPYLVMEYVDGGTIAELTGEPILPERAAEIVSQAAWGAGAAHSAGMVHRDIKPGNILLTESGDAKLADFGIASSTSGEQLTATGQAIGSPHYVSPEQAAGRSCGPRSDVYSLGVVLYELITGKPPFDGDNITAIAIAHVESTPARPSEHVPDLDEDLEAIVMRCLEKDPAERFEDGRALGAALEEPAAAAAFLPPEIDLDLEEETGGGGRVLATVLIALLVLGLVAVGVVAAGRDSTEPREMSYDQETENLGKKPSRRRPSPSPTADSQTASVSNAAVASPAPSPTPTNEKKRSTASGSNTSAASEDTTTEPSPEPTTEPSPEPTTEPTTEPSPAPTTTSE